MMDDGLTGEIELDDVRVPADNVVGDIGDGFGLAMTYINWRRLCRGGSVCADGGSGSSTGRWSGHGNGDPVGGPSGTSRRSST